MSHKKIRRLYAGIILLFFAAVLGSLCLGAANLNLNQLWHAVVSGPGSGYEGHIFWYVRLPRTAGAAAAGAGLAVAGAVIQAVLANPLASPGIIGVNSGAGMAVTLCYAFGILNGWAISAASFAGALFAVMVVTFTAQKMKASRTTVVMGGIAVNSFFGAVSESITTLIPDAAVLSADFKVGGFSSISYLRLIPAVILILIALICVFSFCNELDLMNLGEETAQSLGLSVKKMRTLLLILAALLAGASVSFAGVLSFVGLIVPHTIRRFTGSESRYLLPLCALGGAGFVTLCDLISRIIFMPYEIPVGILMSFIGAPFFVWLLLKKKAGHSHA